MPLAAFHPAVRRWFEQRFPSPTLPQLQAWPAIAGRGDVLVSAPTGSGKTLAAFLSALDGLARDAAQGRLSDQTRVLYVSPLRALSNDVERNLRQPLQGIRQAAAELGLTLPELRVEVRTGDTPGARRQAILRRPPHVLVTTPESLYLLLTAERGRALLASVETAIVDELHAVARDKRGAHLALSLERLEALARRRPQRIGLSATVEPLEEMARFLVGAARVDRAGRPRCALIEVDRRRALDLGVEVPRDELSSVASNELWADTYDRIAEQVRAHRSTIVFVNTRRLSERAAHALEERLGPGTVAAHHGSLARERRLAAEERLKAGDLKAIVATASLELGIDVGAVELVVQVGTPGALGVGLQRIGRAGHVDGGVPRGRLFPVTRDELVECAALVRGLRRGRLESVRIPEAPLDVLAQQLTAEAACGPIHLDHLYALATRAWPYRALSRAAFDGVVELLSEGVSRGGGRRTALLHRDGVNGRVRGRRGAQLAALTGAGAIPDTAQYAVVAEPEGAVVGQVDEDFAVETMAGDVFLLGNTGWRVQRVEASVVRVEDARGAPPTVPFWNGEAPGRSRELSEEVSALREALEPRLADPAGAATWLQEECALPEPGARLVVEYLAAGRAALGALPTRRTLIAERFFDEAGGMQLVVHAPLGARVNRALGLALRKRFCRTFDFELQAAATDEGVLLSLGPQHSFPLESIFHLVSEASVDEVLTQAALQAPMFGVRWRWAATRALLLPRMINGRKVPPPLARMRAQDLLAAVFPAQVACQDNAAPGPLEIPDNPLVAEALRDCLTEAMDAPALRELLGEIRRGELRLLAVDTPEPSPLAHELVGARPWAYLDDAPLEERRARAVAVRRGLPPAEAAALGALDPAAISEVEGQVRPDPRDADELHALLLDLVLLPGGEVQAAGWEPLLAELAAAGRARLQGGQAVATEREERARAALAGDLAAVAGVVRGWVGRSGPLTAAALAARLRLPERQVAGALELLESEGLVLRGRFLPEAPWSAEAPHWCERTLLARIHRLTLGRLRREIEPVSTAELIRFLARWQHVAPGTRLHGPRGLAEVIGQLQGFQAAAGVWERDLLPARVAGYDPAWLDALCLSGEVAWGRLSAAEPPTAREPAEPRASPERRSAPTRAAPVTLVLREDLPWLLEAARAARPSTGSGRTDEATGAGRTDAELLGPCARDVLAALGRRGASFPAELASATGRPAAEVEGGLWELVSAGLATCDGFGGLRGLLAGGRPSTGSGRAESRGGGRWSLLREQEPQDEALSQPTLEKLAQQYLRRYGVVFRDLLAREPAAPPWRELVRVLRTLEARGTIRGGRFVAGRSGEQFALPEAVDALRAVRRSQHEGERVELSAADPLNLSGVILPGPRVPAGGARRVAYVDGVPEEPAAAAAEAGASAGVAAGR